ncbi:MAG: hypothetical protein GY725_01645 [bacterium]|nr:hypothetical protein [bacterium]
MLLSTWEQSTTPAVALSLHQVFERLDWEVDEWTKWSNETPFMRGFRQMTFSKIVPNLKRLGLLTPRIRDAYTKMGLIKYEDLKDSVEEPSPPAPQEVVNLHAEVMASREESGKQVPTAD